MYIILYIVIKFIFICIDFFFNDKIHLHLNHSHFVDVGIGGIVCHFVFFYASYKIKLKTTIWSGSISNGDLKKY